MYNGTWEMTWEEWIDYRNDQLFEEMDWYDEEEETCQSPFLYFTFHTCSRKGVSQAPLLI